MHTISALTSMASPALHVWRDKTDVTSATLAYDVPSTATDEQGWPLFHVRLDHQLHESARAQLHCGDQWESREHQRTLPRGSQYRFAPEMWIVQGTARVLTRSPFLESLDQVRVHLVTASKYRGGRLLLWLPNGNSRSIEPAGEDDVGPFFDVALTGAERHLFAFKFVDRTGSMFEPDQANRLWCAHDGREIWAHSQSNSICTHLPRRRSVTIHFKEHGPRQGVPLMRLWQEDSDFVVDVQGEVLPSGWVRFTPLIYSERPYRFMFFNLERKPVWEHEEAKRTICVSASGEPFTLGGRGQVRMLGDDPVGSRVVWTLEGDHELFDREPKATRSVSLQVCAATPGSPLSGFPPSELTLDVWINRGRTLQLSGLAPNPDGRFSFRTFEDVVTSFRFRHANDTESLERHTLKLSSEEREPSSEGPGLRRFAPGTTTDELYVVLDRADPLPQRPPDDLFSDPPFAIERPGAWVADGHLRLALHAPGVSWAQVIGEWTGWRQRPVSMRSTRDGAYWWAQISTRDVCLQLGRPSVHQTPYKFLLNGVIERQDPAADWVASSSPEAASYLVDHERYTWRSNTWQRPGWEYFTVYQLHPDRFSGRGSGAPLERVRREIADPQGYLRTVGCTAIMLLPINEFAGDHSWGYNPSFFYAVESCYGGPDGLKELIDTCHDNGVAVLIDVVFNHAGTSDNVLWSVARESFFDGDTSWGAMINYDHPQVRHFFEQNLVHFMRKYRVDGFRLDATQVIRRGDQWIGNVRQPGSGGGWQFLHGLRAAVHSEDPRCILIAEHLPNEWDLTRLGGPMDSQWCDSFHDRLVEACRGWQVMPQLALAMQVTHSECMQWYEAMNYPESHDEVGNVNDRIANVAGPGQGLRRNKVAAAATLLGRGIPMWFMGAESGEWRQFVQSETWPLDLDQYETNESSRRVRQWWSALCGLRRGNPTVQGPAPLAVRFADQGVLAFVRGDAADVFVVLNFGSSSGGRSLSELNLPSGAYQELWNSSWPAFAVEGELERSNGGRDARLDRASWLNLPDFGAVILQRA